MSDATCTALQLANFWQDVTVDQQKDRVYLPLDLLAKHNYTVEDLFARRFDERFRGIMHEAVDRARELFLKGLPLNRMVNRRLSIDLELFSRGGMRILDKIEQQDYDVLSRRPKISKIERVSLLLGTLARMAFARAALSDAYESSLEESYVLLPRGGEEARAEFLLFVRPAASREEECDVRDLCVHALLRRFER